MAYVITQLCVDCLDKGCVDVCPVDCIYELADAPSEVRPNMLYIHPTDCINCGACEPECPWQAIYEDQEMPAGAEQDVALNALCAEQPQHFRLATIERDEQGNTVRRPLPGPAEVAANRRRHGR